MLAVASPPENVEDDDDPQERQEECIKAEKDWSMFNPYVPGPDKKLYNAGTISQLVFNH